MKYHYPNSNDKRPNKTHNWGEINFTSSTYKDAAIKVRRNLRIWFQGVKVAKKMSSWICHPVSKKILYCQVVNQYSNSTSPWLKCPHSTNTKWRIFLNLSHMPGCYDYIYYSWLHVDGLSAISVNSSKMSYKITMSLMHRLLKLAYKGQAYTGNDVPKKHFCGQ